MPDLAAGLWPVLKEATDTANGLALKIKGATSGKEDRVSAILTTSDDPEIVTWREQDAKVQAQIKAAQEKLAEARDSAAKKAESLLTDSADFNVEEAKKEFLTKRQEVTSISKTIKLVLKGDEKAYAAGIESAGIVEVLSLRGSNGATSGSLGKRKPRLHSATVNGETLEKATFTTLAAKTGVDVDTLKDAAFKAAETDDLKSVAGKEVSFSVVNKKNETVKVVIVAKGDDVATTETDSDEESETDSTDSE